MSARFVWWLSIAVTMRPITPRSVRLRPSLALPPETLRQWVRRAEVDSGQWPGVTSEESVEIRRLWTEVKELRPANEILKAASDSFAAVLDGPLTHS